jgi:hypothetical protein
MVGYKQIMIHKFLYQDKSKGHYHKHVCHQSYGNQGTNINRSVTVAEESRFSVNSHHVATPIFTTTPAVVSETSSSINNITRGIDNVHVTSSCKDYLPQSQIYNTPKLKENQIQFSKFSQIPHNLFKIELNLHVTIMAKGR